MWDRRCLAVPGRKRRAGEGMEESRRRESRHGKSASSGLQWLPVSGLPEKQAVELKDASSRFEVPALGGVTPVEWLPPGQYSTVQYSTVQLQPLEDDSPQGRRCCIGRNYCRMHLMVCLIFSVWRSSRYYGVRDVHIRFVLWNWRAHRLT